MLWLVGRKVNAEFSFHIYLLSQECLSGGYKTSAPPNYETSMVCMIPQITDILSPNLSLSCFYLGFLFMDKVCKCHY